MAGYTVNLTHPAGFLIVTEAARDMQSAIDAVVVALEEGYTVTVVHGAIDKRYESDSRPKTCSLCGNAIAPKASDIGLVHGSWRAQHQACRDAAKIEAAIIRTTWGRERDVAAEGQRAAR